METVAFCTCKHHECPHNPVNHDKGCTPCIESNLKQKKLPSCFFHSLPHLESRKGDTYHDFAELVLENERLQAQE